MHFLVYYMLYLLIPKEEIIMEIRLFNSLTNKVEIFKPIKEGKVSMYVCGPTVYDYVHVGNMRPVVVFDVLRRFFEYVGYDVTYVSNYTDVDDKIITKAKNTGKSEKEITDFYIGEFEKDVHEIHSRLPNITPRVTDTMPQIIDFIDNLVKIGAAYVVDDDVYFKVGSDEKYGVLSNTNTSDLLVGARIDENMKKLSPLDFTLWKKTDVGVRWSSPWSDGRPGWHTECVVMINSLFEGGRIDIHGGGFDLKFPHHENEIAQSEVCHGHAIANYWMHNGFININSEKMSKSLGNVVTAHEALKTYGGNTVRLLLLSTHYRAPVNFAPEMLASNEKEILKMQTAYRQIGVKLQLNNISVEEGTPSDMTGFISALADDLNTSNALSELFKVLKEGNTLLRTREIDFERLTGVFFSLKDMLSILGLELELPILTEEDKELFKEYDLSKANKDFAKSDEIRKVLIEKHLM